jgi:hypothetical protein
MPGPTIETDKIIPEREDTHDKTFGLQEELNRIFKEENKSKWKKGQTGEKIYPFPETQEDILDRYEFPMKMQDGDIEEENRIMREPFFARQELDTWANGNLIVDQTRTLSYFNGKRLPVPINFYKGITRQKDDQFEEVAPFNISNYSEGTGMFFSTDLDDAFLSPRNTLPELEEVRLTKLQEIKNSKRTDNKRASTLQVHIAPKNGLNLITFKKGSTFIRDPKDYEKILSATRQLILKNDSKLNEDQRGLTTFDFNRKLLEVGNNAEDSMIRKANITKDGEMFLSNDPSNPLPGQRSEQSEETWRWKFQHPDRRGQLTLDELTSFMPSKDFSDIAKAAGYTSSIIQYHPDSPFMREISIVDDPNSFYEVVIYNT